MQGDCEKGFPGLRRGTGRPICVPHGAAGDAQRNQPSLWSFPDSKGRREERPQKGGLWRSRNSPGQRLSRGGIVPQAKKLWVQPPVRVQVGGDQLTSLTHSLSLLSPLAKKLINTSSSED